jgi:hypothetical protein
VLALFDDRREREVVVGPALITGIRRVLDLVRDDNELRG